ncbi:hypothetical protein [Caldibacillus thermoamylovorans]|uniref:hypothetical protein n=1 Tax=Caldibacillus thermoamylovorans TaxID=35841 RepID=UPI0022E20E84|nr:hypothetical protein [Caldibacillus thermoamylovorans]
MTTSPNLVTILRRETPFFDDKTYSRHHFGVEKAQFWRRDPFSSPFWGEKLHFLTTSLNLVTVFK